MGRLVPNPDGTVGTPPDGLFTAPTALLIVAGIGVLLVLLIVLARRAGRRYDATLPDKTSWWSVVLDIERPYDGTVPPFRARTARLVWHSSSADRRRADFEGLWQTPEGNWFFVHASFEQREFGGIAGPLEPNGAFVKPLTPRRAYNALLPYRRLLAQEFPDGPPSNAHAGAMPASRRLP